jgi:hypothetical protein
MTDCEYVDPSKLRPGPIRHKSLPPKLLEHIEAVFEVIGPYLNTTLEEFEIGFMPDVLVFLVVLPRDRELLGLKCPTHPEQQ